MNKPAILRTLSEATRPLTMRELCDDDIDCKCLVLQMASDGLIVRHDAPEHSGRGVRNVYGVVG